MSLKLKSKGKLGENIAASYLQKKGYRIIARNFKARHAEIDLIALNKNALVFVEVKTRWGNSFGEPVEAVTARKIKLITTAAQYFKMLHSELPEMMQIDVVGINLCDNDKLDKIEHLTNVTA